MKRTQIQLDEQTYKALRQRAYEERRSMSAVIRELLAQALTDQAPRRRLTLADFSFVGAGRSEQDPRFPVSEYHDEALAEIWAKEHGITS